MAVAREIIELTIEDGWTLIPIGDGLITVERDTMWSTVNTEPLSGFLPYAAIFDYDIYIKMTDDTTFKKHQYSITRR